ncbi:MAG: hypothetical protein ACI915_000568 [Gammaproteobacteria bacterium]|jgi:hypothetical protein
MGLLVFVDKQETNNDQSDIVDTLVDAGIWFSTGQTDSELLKHRKLVVATDISAACAERTI